MKEFKRINFKIEESEIDINIIQENNTIWMNLNEISKLYQRSKSVISKHLKNILAEDEFRTVSSVAKNATVATNGKPYNMNYYTLDLVIDIGYKIGSNKGQLLKNFVANNLNSHANLNHNNSNQIIIYDNGVVHIPFEISGGERTVWATQEQIATLYETTQPNVSMHIKNILEDAELSVDSVYKKSLYTAPDGKQYFVIFYNLDMILAIGYRVKTTKAIAFRKWATSVLKEYLIDGYSINEQKCADCKDYLINLSQRVYRLEQLSTNSIVYFPGDELRGFIEIKRFLETAKQEICIIDNYFGHEFDDVLINVNVKKTIITNPKNIKVDTCENYKVIKVDDIHDRYIMVDDIWYTFGGSPKDIGTSISTGHLFTEEKLIQIFRNYINEEK